MPGIKNSDKIINGITINNKREAIFDVNATPACNPYFSFFSVNKGINAAEKAPSAKNFLNKFGILKASKKASATAPEPSIEANKISLIKPIILLHNVQKPTTALDL